MKKIIMIILSVVLIAGIVGLGFLIFNSKSIASAKIEGTMQTLYVAGQDIDFEDAKIKVTYKNGNIKMIDLDNKNVKISNFSTSLKTHGTMKITYKSQVIEVDYDVIEAGMYYVSETEKIVVGGSPIVSTFDSKSSNQMVYIRANGECDYYYKDDNGSYLMHDGSYDKSYNYKIVGDTLTVRLGSKSNTLEIKADYNKNGSVAYKQTKIEIDESTGLEKSKTISTFTHYEMKSDFYRRIQSSQVELKYVNASRKDGDVVIFKQNENIETSEQVILLKLTFNDDFLTEVFVHVCDEMVASNSLYTKDLTGADTMRIFYQKGDTNADVSIHYKVVKNI